MLSQIFPCPPKVFWGPMSPVSGLGGAGCPWVMDFLPPPKKNFWKKNFFLFSSNRASEAPVWPTQDSQRSIKLLGSLRGG